MSDPAWIDAAVAAARPRAVGALLRYFRDLDTAEEAYQDACLRALKNWPENGPPRDPAAWLIMVGRNAGLDGVRKKSRQTELPPEEAISDVDDVETPMAEAPASITWISSFSSRKSNTFGIFHTHGLCVYSSCLRVA